MNSLGSPLSGTDHAQAFLVPYLKETEAIFRSALRSIDLHSECRITPAADLCIPHDVVRIAGGFATGCLVEWRCSTPVVPIDTTVNIDITSLYVVDDDASINFQPDFFENLRRRVDEETSYEWNLHKGNHFIASVQRRSDGKHALFFHSNEKEFKYQYNGLMPVPGNWYWDDVRVFRAGGRYIRLLVGQKAKLFYDISRMLHDFTILRHSFLANQILPKQSQILEAKHDFHYYMPTSQSVAIGCYLTDTGQAVPVLSKPGSPIDVFRPSDGGQNEVRLYSGETKKIVPHGWGKTSRTPLTVSFDESVFTMNGASFPIEPKATLGKHPELMIRDFSSDPASENSLYARMRVHCPGEIADRYDQIAWYNKDGINRR